ncbi:DUF1648 domain-containing protein [Latilactobacillus sakei]|uniref:DUF1648 domain-containing protein n=1 Tax=Latilactobacillus sakei TaxID=1599 RepID=UPI0038884AF4
MVSLIVCLGFITIAPTTIPTHFTGSNLADSSGNKYTLLIYPLIQVILNQAFIFVAQRYRQPHKLTNFPTILANE